MRRASAGTNTNTSTGTSTRAIAQTKAQDLLSTATYGH
jgi:hypothetical protein